MSNTSFIRNGLFLVAASLLTLAACKKSTSNNNQTQTTLSADDNGGYASDASKLESANNDVLSVSDFVATTGSTSNLRVTSPYPTFTKTVSGTDTTLTIDFGTAGVTGLDGKTRKGQIIVNYTGPYKASGSTRTITTNNYFLGTNQILAHKTVDNMGTNDSGQVYYNVTVNDTILLDGSTDSTISWTGTRTRTWFAGYPTAERLDDVYLIGGVTSVTRADGNVYTFTISTADPLKIAVACPYIEAGTVVITSSSFTAGSRTLNYTYGGGGCDAWAQLTIGTTTYTIYLH